MNCTLDFDVCDYLSCLLKGNVEGIGPLSGGDWSRAFAFVCGNRPWVARFGRYLEDFEKDQAAAAFSSTDMPVPEVLAIAEAPSGWCCVSERKEGIHLDDLDPS